MKLVLLYSFLQFLYYSDFQLFNDIIQNKTPAYLINHEDNADIVVSLHICKNVGLVDANFVISSEVVGYGLLEENSGIRGTIYKYPKLYAGNLSTEKMNISNKQQLFIYLQIMSYYGYKIRWNWESLLYYLAEVSPNQIEELIERNNKDFYVIVMDLDGYIHYWMEKGVSKEAVIKNIERFKLNVLSVEQIKRIEM